MQRVQCMLPDSILNLTHKPVLLYLVFLAISFECSPNFRLCSISLPSPADADVEQNRESSLADF